jgi:hypothetical protein
MAYIIGTDEAGYGPNLGPLVISASLWRVANGTGSEDLFQRIRHVFARSLDEADGYDPPRAVIADSKLLYRSSGDLRHLERGLWAAWALLGQQPRRWREVWHALAPEALDELRAATWFNDYDAPLPSDCAALQWSVHAARLQEALMSEGVSFEGLCSRAVFPREFNTLLNVYGSKGAMLSHLTLELIERTLRPLPSESISVFCDKHGGRSFYGPLLSRYFPDCLVEVRRESRAESVYCFGPARRRIKVSFSINAERFLSSALASMASKYLRELAMQAFNEFWCSRVSGLLPTAGYPGDARRFLSSIAPTQRQLGIDNDIIWRAK